MSLRLKSKYPPFRMRSPDEPLPVSKVGVENAAMPCHKKAFDAAWETLVQCAPLAAEYLRGTDENVAALAADDHRGRYVGKFFRQTGPQVQQRVDIFERGGKWFGWAAQHRSGPVLIGELDKTNCELLLDKQEGDDAASG
jgi:hypothetical protein